MKPKINKTITTRGGGNIIIPNKIISKEYPGGENNNKEPDIYICKITNLDEASQSILTDIYISGSAPTQKIVCLNPNDGDINKRLFKSSNKYYYESIIVLYKRSLVPSTFYYTYSIASSSYEKMGTASWWTPSELIFLSYSKNYLELLISDLNPIIKYETNFKLD